MKLENKSKRAYIAFGVRINAGEVKDIDDKKVIDILLKQPDIVEYADIKEQEELIEENKRLKEQLKAQEEKNTVVNTDKTPKKTPKKQYKMGRA